MRCPKCSYISFDHQDACAKCNHGLTELVSQLRGTAIEVDTPFFLGAAIGALDGGSDEGMLVPDGIDIEPVMEEEVDFQMEPDFELAGETVEAPEMADFQLDAAEEEVDFQLDAADEAAEEKDDFQLDAADGAAEEEVDFQLDAADGAAEEEVDFQLDAAGDTGEEAARETVPAEEKPVAVEAASMDTDELLDTTLADLDDFDLGDMGINLDKDFGDLPPDDPLPEEKASVEDDELSTTDLDEMFAGLDFDDQKDDEVEPTVAGDETIEQGLDIGNLTLESDGEEEKPPQTLSDLELTLEIDDA